MSRIVVALGGNALSVDGKASASDQQAVAASTAAKLASLILAGHELVIVHGNGPQIGNIILHEEAINTQKTPTMPVDTCSAMSQGQIGYWLQNAFINHFKNIGVDQSVASIVTQVLVDKNDPAFKNPTKPIGPFYQEDEAKKLAQEKQITIKEDAGRGWRKVVPSPKPISIIELDFVRSAIENGHTIITAGGGGIPVIYENNSLKGIEAVIDKDFAAAKLADEISADVLLILTAVDSVKIDYGKTNESSLKNISVAELRQYIKDNQFAPGSMLPKIEASIQFVENSNSRSAIITSLADPLAALFGIIGTTIKK